MDTLFARFKTWLLVLFAAAALYLLYREIRHYSWHEIQQSLKTISAWRVGVAVLLAAFSYVILIGSDILALQSIGRKLPLVKVAVCSLLGTVSAFNFGTLVGGTSVRYWLYSRLGLSTVEVLQIALLLGVTFWIGFFALAGLVFTLHPVPLPESIFLPSSNSLPIGIVLLIVTAGYIGFSFIRWQPWIRWGYPLRLPGPWATLGQLGISSLDFLAATACLHILLGDQPGMEYGELLRVVLLATLATVVTHVPGGVGVFELVIIKLCPVYSKPHLLAGLLMFRVVYYLLPLLFAALGVGGYQLYRWRSRLHRNG